MNTVLLKLGIISAPLRIIYTDIAVFTGMTYVYLPLMVLPLFAACSEKHRKCWTPSSRFTP